MEEKKAPIIIKKVKKKHGGGHHGGSWKVAYADFVTAMMAFFLLLWLITFSSGEKRAVLSQYFKNFSLFEQSGESFMAESSQIFQESGGEAKSLLYDKGSGPGEISAENLKEKLKHAIETKLQSIGDQIVVDILGGGVRIQLQDSEKSTMFPLGSDLPNKKAKKALRIIAENTSDIPNRIVIEGHTDSVPFKSSKITNWELSTSRASAARRELEKNGIDPERIARVVGYADNDLLIVDNPKDPRNRRISIIILFQEKKVPFQ